MKKAILKEIVYENIGEFEIHTVTNDGIEINYFVKKIDGKAVTREDLEFLKEKTILFEVDKEKYTNLTTSINIYTN